MLTQFDAFLIVFFLMLAAIILIAVAGIVDSYLDPNPDAAGYDKAAQASQMKGVQL